MFEPAIYEQLEDRLAVLLQVPLIGQPGKQWYYSAATDVLALIVQKVSGQPINTYLTEHIFTPLGMNETGYNLTEESTKRVMKVHLKNEEGELIENCFLEDLNFNKGEWMILATTNKLLQDFSEHSVLLKGILDRQLLNQRSQLK